MYTTILYEIIIINWLFAQNNTVAGHVTPSSPIKICYSIFTTILLAASKNMREKKGANYPLQWEAARSIILVPCSCKENLKNTHKKKKKPDKGNAMTRDS